MRPPISASLSLQVAHARVAVASVPAWEDGQIALDLDDSKPVRLAPNVMAVRHAGCWSRHRDGGRCTLDLVPAGADRMVALLTLEQPRRFLARPVQTRHVWSALTRLRDLMEAGGAAIQVPTHGPPSHTETQPSPASTPPIPSGILPS